MRSNCQVEIPNYEDIEEYMSVLQSQKTTVLLCGSIEIDSKTKKSIERLITSKWLTIWRENDVKQILSYFCNEYIKASVTLELPLLLTEKAYMTDAGEMAISRYFLYRAGGQRVLKILLHEVAHWWLAKQRDYGRLLQLDQAFRKGNRECILPLVLSPIEMFATKLECEIMLNVSNCFDKRICKLLYDLGLQEQNRINAAMASLSL